MRRSDPEESRGLAKDPSGPEVTVQLNVRILTDVRHLAGAASNAHGITFRQVIEARGNTGLTGLDNLRSI